MSLIFYHLRQYFFFSKPANKSTGYILYRWCTTLFPRGRYALVYLLLKLCYRVTVIRPQCNSNITMFLCSDVPIFFDIKLINLIELKYVIETIHSRPACIP